MNSNYNLLSYDSSKYVMMYLDPNLRLNLTQRCPSLSTVERIVPQRIKELQIGSHSFKVNGTSYVVGVIQLYKNGQTPISVRNKNADGGVRIDVDQYGIDVTEQGDDQRRVERLEGHKQRIEQQQRYEKVSYSLSIEACELKILSYNLRRQNAVPPFDHYLQISVESGTVNKKERLSYDKTIVEARDYLFKKLFGGVGKTTQVYLLRSELFFNIRPLLPLANGKLEVQHLEINVRFLTRESLQFVKPVMWKKPLKSLQVCGGGWIKDLCKDPFITSVEHLIINGRSSIKTVLDFMNDKVHLKYCTFNKDMVNGMIKEWQRQGLGIGKEYSIGFEDEKEIEEFLEILKEYPGSQIGELVKTGWKGFPHCIVIPICEQSELHVYCVRVPIEDKKSCEGEFNVIMKTQPRGHAVNLFP